MNDLIVISLCFYLIGGAWALVTNDSRIAASTSSVAYILLLIGGKS